jgi:hypothetical protein
MDKHPLLARLLHIALSEGFKTTVVDRETAHIHRLDGTHLHLTAGDDRFFLNNPRPGCLAEAILETRMSDTAFGYWTGLEAGSASAWTPRPSYNLRPMVTGKDAPVKAR